MTESAFPAFKAALRGVVPGLVKRGKDNSLSIDFKKARALAIKAAGLPKDTVLTKKWKEKADLEIRIQMVSLLSTLCI
jgi:hypothetical protein